MISIGNSTRRAGVVATVVLATALAVVPSSGALAIDPPPGGGGGGVAPPTTPATYSLSGVAFTQGDPFDVTFTPGTYGLRDFCNYSSYDTGAVNSSPGFSAFLSFSDGVNQTNVGLQPSGQGQGSFTPTTQSAPMTVSFTVPADLPAATYTVGVTCVGPTSPYYYTWTSVPAVSFGSVTVAAAPEAPTSPGDSGSTSTGELPNTGMSSASAASMLGGASALIALGAGLTVWRRKRA